MRNFQLAICAAALMVSGPAWAQGESTVPARTPAMLPNDADVEIIPSVTPGDQIGIACNALTRSNPESDVRVVLTISAQPGETPPGYKKVLATDAEVGHGAVRVRIPTVPDIEDHLVNVNVYVLGNEGAESCDAGHMKIVHQRTASAPGSVG